MKAGAMGRREFLRAAGAAAGFVAAAGGFGIGAAGGAAAGAARDAPGAAGHGGTTRPAGTESMNVLLIDIEDCTPNAIGCYGNPIPRTPNLDRLSATGVRFERAYIQYPCCNPSRSSFLTGLRPPTTGMLSNEMNMMATLPKHAVTLPELLKAKGFYTANIGKLFHRVEQSVPQMVGFDRLEMSAKPAGWKGPGPLLKWPAVPRPAGEPPRPQPGDTKSPEYRKWKKWHSDRYGDSGLTEEQETDARIARTAVALLEEFARDKRHFFLSVGSARPHTPLIAPRKYLDLYDPAKIPPPPAPPEADRDIPDVARKFGRSADIFMDRKATEKEAREAIAAYYACVGLVDAGIGLILDCLERTGLARNTIIIFLADHGFHLGEHGLWSKYTLFESSTRAPLIVHVPGAAGNGKPCGRIVEFVDLVPTLCELCGLTVSPHHEGTSFAPLLADPARPWKKAAFTWFGNKGENRSVRTAGHRYAEWKWKGETFREFYDLQADPWETINRVNDPSLAALVREHAELLQAGWKAALPPSGGA